MSTFDEMVRQIIADMSRHPHKEPQLYCSQCNSPMEKKGLDSGQYRYDRIRYKGGYRRIAIVCSEKCAQEYESQNLPSRFLLIEEGYVYLMCSKNGYKIGMSKDPRKRRKELQRQIKQPLKLIHIIKAPFALAAEKYFQYNYRSRRIKGDRRGREWFDLTEGHVQFIQSHTVLEAWRPYCEPGVVVAKFPLAAP